MSKRLLKQIAYGVIYLIALSGVIYSIYLFIILQQPASCFDGRRNQSEEETDCGGPCVSCGLKNVRAIATSTPQILEVRPDLVSAIAEIRNPNTDFGVESFGYNINFYDRSGNKTHTVKGNSFIYPGEIKLIAEPAIVLPFNQIARGEILIENISWLPAKDFQRPDVQVRDFQTKKTGNQAVVTGLLFNNNSYKLSRVGVSAVVFNNLGFRLGVSKTTLQDIQPSEQRFFSISIPIAAVQDFDTRLTKVFVEARR